MTVMEMDSGFEFTARIAADHPALAGHFPGYPIVPGVVTLNQVARAFALWRPDARIGAWPQVKFVTPLMPEEGFTIRLTLAGPELVRFSLQVEARLVVSGQFVFLADA